MSKKLGPEDLGLSQEEFNSLTPEKWQEIKKLRKAEANKRWFKKDYSKNIERYKERSKKFRLENPEKVREFSKKFALENPEKIKEMRKRYELKNPEKILKDSRKVRERIFFNPEKSSFKNLSPEAQEFRDIIKNVLDLPESEKLSVPEFLDLAKTNWEQNVPEGNLKNILNRYKNNRAIREERYQKTLAETLRKHLERGNYNPRPIHDLRKSSVFERQIKNLLDMEDQKKLKRFTEEIKEIPQNMIPYKNVIQEAGEIAPQVEKNAENLETPIKSFAGKTGRGLLKGLNWLGPLAIGYEALVIDPSEAALQAMEFAIPVPGVDFGERLNHKEEDDILKIKEFEKMRNQYLGEEINQGFFSRMRAA